MKQAEQHAAPQLKFRSCFVWLSLSFAPVVQIQNLQELPRGELHMPVLCAEILQREVKLELPRLQMTLWIEYLDDKILSGFKIWINYNLVSLKDLITSGVWTIGSRYFSRPWKEDLYCSWGYENTVLSQWVKLILWIYRRDGDCCRTVLRKKIAARIRLIKRLFLRLNDILLLIFLIVGRSSAHSGHQERYFIRKPTWMYLITGLQTKAAVKTFELFRFYHLSRCVLLYST